MVHCVDGVGFSGVIATAGDKRRRGTLPLAAQKTGRKKGLSTIGLGMNGCD